MVKDVTPEMKHGVLEVGSTSGGLWKVWEAPALFEHTHVFVRGGGAKGGGDSGAGDGGDDGMGGGAVGLP